MTTCAKEERGKVALCPDIHFIAVLPIGIFPGGGWGSRNKKYL